jgi:hypothetical protein
MTSLRRSWSLNRRALVAVAVIWTCTLPARASAQAVEVVPLAGYRFNNDLFEVAANRPVDLDGAPVLGIAVNVATGHGQWFETVFTRQEATAAVPVTGIGPPLPDSRVTVDQALAGARQEFGAGRARPFLTGVLGLTHYAADGDDEVRFTLGAGGGLRLPLQRHLGVRLDSRLLTTFVDVDARAAACGAGRCAASVHVNVVWQFEFTADVMVVF